jgi:hypothetical protein
MKAFQPTDVEIIRTAIRNRLADVRTSIPAVVKSYDAATQTCSCELAMRIPTSDGAPEAVTPLEDVPVVWPRGGGYFCAMPLAVGDAGLLVFSEVDFSSWRESGDVSDAVQERRHGMYGYFVPGGCASGKELAGASATKLVIGKDGGPTMKVDAALIELSAGGTVDFVAKAAAVKARLDALASAISGWTPVPNDGGAALKVALSSWLGGSNAVAATKVQVE